MTKKTTGQNVKNLVEDLLNWASEPEEPTVTVESNGPIVPLLDICEKLTECVALGTLDDSTSVLDRQMRIAERVKAIRETLNMLKGGK